jgi:hypothetical protein
MSDDEGSSGDASGSSLGTLERWVLLEGSRAVVAGLTTLAIFAFVLAVSASPYSPLEDQQPIFYAFSSLISGNLTIVTVVVSINQLLLSRELRTPSELETEIEGMVDYRRKIEDAAGQVAPVEPLGFLRLIFETARQQAQQLGGLAVTETDERVAEDVDRVVTKLTQKFDRIDTLLQSRNVGTFQVLATTLGTNYAREINKLRRIKSGHGDQLPADVEDSIDDLVHHLQDIDVARQYLKSIYLQQELASLSRLLFYTGLPSVTVVAAALLLFTAPGQAHLPEPVVTLLVPAVVTVGLFPLTVLFAYILRTATVARRTAAVIPFTVPTQESGD